ncbi:hypothetical protein SAMN00120144_0067 [Hymenobacter roseosalivarius DSM 11622]|uniref:Uncharacterized protein n=1 Tax=Hymenobacter roseosalivarius DSM 11622 TaxID=645990 RepID=A0A1W1W0P6_9BACT|nr:hypothetical protein SAMN00120144_0067 [Hymenobacter roseosalivarius DSM 11622]
MQTKEASRPLRCNDNPTAAGEMLRSALHDVLTDADDLLNSFYL